MLICILLDNHSAHRSRETQCFLASKPGRFEIVFTPTHASWLNWVETYFSKMSIRPAPYPGHQQGRAERSDATLYRDLQPVSHRAQMVLRHPSRSGAVGRLIRFTNSRTNVLALA